MLHRSTIVRPPHITTLREWNYLQKRQGGPLVSIPRHTFAAAAAAGVEAEVEKADADAELLEMLVVDDGDDE